MGRVKRKPVENQISNVHSDSGEKNNDTQSLLCQKLSSRSKSSMKTLKERCSSQPVYHVEKAVALEHIWNSPSPKAQRSVLGDKTNKSPKSPSNLKQKFKTPPLEQQKTSHPLSISNNEDSLLLHTCKLNTSKNISSGKKALLIMKSSSGIVEKHSKSSNSDKCVYAKVQRESMRSRNMLLDEKMAQYEFEVDENEPVVKQKKKKNVKRKKKATSANDKEYFPSSKMFKRILLSDVEEAAKKAKEKEDLVEQNLKSMAETPKEGICTQFISNNNKTQQAVSTSSLCPFVRKSSSVLMENFSPVARPKSQSSQPRRSVSLKDFPELELSVGENSSMCDSKILEKFRLSCSTLNVSSEPSTLSEALKSRPNNESGNLSSSAKLQLTPDVHEASISTPVINNNHSRRFPFSEITSSTPLFSPLSRNNNTMESVPHSSIDCSASQPHHLKRRVYYEPRMSGGGIGNKELAENWNVENCFGFEESEDTKLLTPLTDISLKQRLRKATNFCSTPVVSNKKTPDRLSMFFKRKREFTTESQSESRQLRVLVKKMAGFSKMEKSENSGTPKLETSMKKSNSPNTEKLSSGTTAYSPFSNLLKQSKLDFITNSEITISETPYQSNQKSPLLFKDSEDKIPTTFKEPARRSYVRSVRRKKIPIGDEWVETDNGSEEEQENERKITDKKRKKEKLSKQEVKEANKWMKDFNHQCEEIEDFELYVE